MATDTFVYEALSHPKREFRLLKIQTYNSETAPSVRCELASFPLDEAPPYHTISYTWGDDEDKAQPILILVNDRQFKALPNSEGALRQAWAYNRDLHIWIDSICINQQDISERNAQVSIMGQIYMNCEQVLACVGDHADDSEFLYKLLRKNADLLCAYSSCNGTRRCVFGNEEERIHAWEAVSRELHREKSSTAPSRYSQALESFLKRRYFTRVWIYQELSLGPSITVCCGLDHIAINPLCALALWHEAMGAVEQVLARPQQQRTYASIEPICISPTIPLLEAGSFSADRKMSSLELFIHVRDAQLHCADPRDKLFGILAMVDWSENGGNMVSPDYTKSVFKVAVEASEIFLNSQHPLYSPRELAEQVVAAFDLSPSILREELKDAIKGRHALISDSLLNPRKEYPPELEQPFRQAVAQSSSRRELLSGFRLVCDDSACTLQQESGPYVLPNLRNSELKIQIWPNYSPEKWNQIRKIQGDSKRHINILLPQVTQPGDWCLFSDSQRYDFAERRWVKHVRHGVCFIARYLHDDKYWIVGKGLWFVDCGAYLWWGIRTALEDEGDDFLGRFGLEDSLVLASYQDIFAELPPIADSRLSEFMDTALCGSPGSSHIRSFSHRKQRHK